ncbi:MAG: radical SAM protein [Candidatus Aenigmarchaeota archaeon]|nr:radical SAM protein [Candidatus Aenigmarchaeota archaeon]
MKNFPFNPLEKANKVEKIVVKDLKRKYYRFRYASYYGGIATADTVGCCFLCAYCWNYFKNLKPENFGKFYSPNEVSKKILEIVEKKNLDRVRISGAEPILGEKSFEHLEKVIQKIYEENPSLNFILETNGLVLGLNEKICEKMVKYPIAVRVSVKGWDESSFEKISGVEGKFFVYQIKALKNLQDFGVEAWPAVMHEVFGEKEIRILKEKLRKMGIEGRIEVEYLEKYSFVTENLKKRGINLNLE